jgi:hypothetical protein
LLLIHLSSTNRLYFEDVSSLLQLEAPQLLPSFDKRSDWLHTLNESGWQVAGSSKSRASKAAASGDVLAHWLASDPEKDWRLQREVAAAEEARKLAEQQAEMRLEGWDDYTQMFWGSGYSMQGDEKSCCIAKVFTAVKGLQQMYLHSSG